MKVFVINLDRRKERMAYMKRQLLDFGVAFERVCAVDGKLMSHCEKRQLSGYSSGGASMDIYLVMGR